MYPKDSAVHALKNWGEQTKWSEVSCLKEQHCVAGYKNTKRTLKIPAIYIHQLLFSIPCDLFQNHNNTRFLRQHCIEDKTTQPKNAHKGLVMQRPRGPCFLAGRFEAIAWCHFLLHTMPLIRSRLSIRTGLGAIFGMTTRSRDEGVQQRAQDGKL